MSVSERLRRLDNRVIGPPRPMTPGALRRIAKVYVVLAVLSVGVSAATGIWIFAFCIGLNALLQLFASWWRLRQSR